MPTKYRFKVGIDWLMVENLEELIDHINLARTKINLPPPSPHNGLNATYYGEVYDVEIEDFPEHITVSMVSESGIFFEITRQRFLEQLLDLPVKQAALAVTLVTGAPQEQAEIFVKHTLPIYLGVIPF